MAKRDKQDKESYEAMNQMADISDAMPYRQGRQRYEKPPAGGSAYETMSTDPTAGAGRGKMGRDAGEIGKSWNDHFKKK